MVHNIRVRFVEILKRLGNDSTLDPQPRAWHFLTVYISLKQIGLTLPLTYDSLSLRILKNIYPERTDTNGPILIIFYCVLPLQSIHLYPQILKGILQIKL